MYEFGSLLSTVLVLADLAPLFELHTRFRGEDKVMKTAQLLFDQLEPHTLWNFLQNKLYTDLAMNADCIQERESHREGVEQSTDNVKRRGSGVEPIAEKMDDGAARGEK